MKRIDCRGLSCPEPVLRTKGALEEAPGGTLTIIVDNQTARENVLRFLGARGLKAEWSEKEGAYYITALKTEAGQDDAAMTTEAADKADRPVLFICTDKLGQGSDELGAMLMRNFIYTLTKTDKLPAAIIFMNSGVRLSIEGSVVIDELLDLENRGVQILACGTCLDYYQLKAKHRAGQTSNMYDISDLLLSAARVVTI